MKTPLSGDEQLILDWLTERGYKSEHEPPVVATGKRPDFLAVAGHSTKTPPLLWAEVKSLQPDSTWLAISNVWPTLKQLGVPTGVRGDAILEVTDHTREQSVRALIKMFFNQVSAYAPSQTRLIFIQQCSTNTDVRCVEVDGPIVEKVWARGAGSGRISVPLSTIENGSALVTWKEGEVLRTEPAYNIFDWKLEFDCALVVHIDPKRTPLTSISPMSHGSSNLPTRTLNALESANSQLRNGYTFIAAPGIVFLVTEEHFDDQPVAMGAYGKLTVSVETSTGQFSEAFYGRDGAFRRDKNTHISAAIRLRRDGAAGTYFPNPYAKDKINENAELIRGLRRAPVQFRYL